MGYHRAGFTEIVGVDIKPQKNYPFTFVQADAMTYPLDGFDAIHASPPCQAYSVATPNDRRHLHPDLLAATRARLQASGLPWVIENVPGSPMRSDFVLCATQFGLPMVRHRQFEMEPRPPHVLLPPCQHVAIPLQVTGHGTNSWIRAKRKAAGLPKDQTIHEAREAMGINWMTRNELSQAIPPAYTEFIGRHLLTALKTAFLEVQQNQ